MKLYSRCSIWRPVERRSIRPWWNHICLLYCEWLGTDANERTEVKFTFRSIVDQVAQFETYLSSKPDGAQWDSSDSLFAFWIGINDVVSGIILNARTRTSYDLNTRETRMHGWASHHTAFVRLRSRHPYLSHRQTSLRKASSTMS